MFSNSENTNGLDRSALRPRAGWPLRGLILLPLALFVILAALSLLRWRTELAEQDEGIRRQTRVAEAQFARRLEESIQEQIRPLYHLRRTWSLGNLHTQGDLVDATLPIWQDRPSYRMVGWADADNIVRFVSPVAGNESLIGQDLLELPHFEEALSRAREDQLEAVAPLFSDPIHGWILSAVIPIFANDATDPPDYRGSIIGQTDIVSTIGALVDVQTRRDFGITVYDGPHVVYDTHGHYRPQPSQVEPVQILDRQLQLSLVPSESFIASHSSNEPRWVLWGGLAGATLVSLAVFQALHHRHRAQERSQAHLEALESLNQITAAITAKAGRGREALERLAETACRLLRADRTAVAVLDDNDPSLIHVLTAYGDRQPDTFRLDDLPLTRRCIETGEIVVYSDDGRLDNEAVNQLNMRRFGYRSIVVLPLRVEERPIGVFVITRVKPVRLTEEEVNLARVWASHAAVTLANIRLNDQMEQALVEQKKLAQYSQALADVNAAVYRAGSVEESTWTIANLAPPALGVNLCVVELVTGEDELLVSASTGNHAREIVGRHLCISGTNIERILRSRQTLVIEDAPSDSLIRAEFRAVMEIGSIVYVPMFRSDETPLGALIFVRHEPGAFSPEQITLAEVFSRRAAVALENAWLHENARRDAETKAMLLRELNHRVKNNLAGIAGLLTANEPDLPPDARQWLNRVIERISTIARAHDLFSGGMERVELGELVAQVLPSLSVLKPPGVHVRTDLDHVVVSLRVERAVSVAMILHELCTNSIIHGLDGHGTVTVRARGLQGRRLALDVMDDGRGLSGEKPCPPPDSEREPVSGRATAVTASVRTGIGLTLVEGLVTRELNGRFTITCPPEGGTVATVEFPLLPDESEEVSI